MQRLDGRLVLSPTDLTAHQECRHLTRLDLGVAAGEWAAPDVETTRRSCSSSSTAGWSTRRSTWTSLKAEGRSVAEIGTVFDARGAPPGGGRDGRGDAQRRRRRLPGDLLRRRLGRAGRLPAARSTAVRFRRLVLRDRRHQARPEAEGRRAAADGHLRRAADGAAGRGAGADPRRHRRRRVAAVAADRRRRVRPPRAGPAGDLRRRAAGDRPLADRLLRAVPLGRAVQRRAAARPTTSAWSPACAATTGTLLRAAGIPTLAGAGDGVAGAAEGVRHRRRRAHPAAAAGGRAAAGAARPGSRRGRCSPPVAGLGLLRLPPPSPGDLYLDFEGDPWFEDGAGIEYLAGLGDRSGAFTAAVGARPAGGEADGRRPDRPAGRRGGGPTRACTSTTTRPTR